MVIPSVITFRVVINHYRYINSAPVLFCTIAPVFCIMVGTGIGIGFVYIDAPADCAFNTDADTDPDADANLVRHLFELLFISVHIHGIKPFPI